MDQEIEELKELPAHTKWKIKEDEMKDFIDHNYNIWEILDKEYFFENKKELEKISKKIIFKE